MAPTFLALVVARALTGVGEASYVVVTPSLVSDYYPPARRGRALAIFYAAIPVGSALGYVLGGAINARFGWRWAFFLAGAPGAALALALLFLARSAARRHGRRAARGCERRPPSLGALARIPSFLFNTAAQIIYTFVVGGLATWMPTYFVRVRHLPLASADLMFGGVLAAAGLVGTLIGGRLGDRMAARHPSGHFQMAGASLILSVPFAVVGIVSPSPAIFWPAMFVALTLLFLNTGPLNAAMANVLPAQLRGWGFAINTMAIHLLGDVSSPTAIGFVSDRVGLQLPGAGHGDAADPGRTGAAGRAVGAGARSGQERHPMSDHVAELEIAAKIAREAAVLVRSYRGKRLHIESKPGNEPVTEADKAANTLILERLSAAFPKDVILSEEVPDSGARIGRSRIWMVDPIDGTSDFILGDTGFVVMIGLVIDGRPMVGAVAHPLSEKVYGGIVGGGAWVEESTGARTPLHTSTIERAPGIRLVASKTHRTPRIDKIKKALQIEDEMNVGSVGLKIGLVSEAVRDLYVYTGGRTKIWDTCAPEAILRGAGGNMTDVDGAPLVYDRDDLYNRRGIVASNGPLHPFVIETLAPHVRTTDCTPRPPD